MSAEEEGVKLSSFQLSALYSSAQAQYASLPTAEPSPRLRAVLKHYQKQALYWMSSRERRQEQRGPSSGRVRRRHPLWEEFHFADGSPFFVNPFSSQLQLAFPESSGLAMGGILGDEMGLGKTVMMISLMLVNHPDSQQDDHRPGGDADGDLHSGSAASKSREELKEQPEGDDGEPSPQQQQRSVTQVLGDCQLPISAGHAARCCLDCSLTVCVLSLLSVCQLLAAVVQAVWAAPR